MNPTIQPDLFEKWMPRRAALRTALGIWLAGVAVAGSTAWRMHHQTVATDETKGIADDVAARPTEAASDTTESEGTVFMPAEVVVGLRTPRIGAPPLTQSP